MCMYNTLGNWLVSVVVGPWVLVCTYSLHPQADPYSTQTPRSTWTALDEQTAAVAVVVVVAPHLGHVIHHLDHVTREAVGHAHCYHYHLHHSHLSTYTEYMYMYICRVKVTRGHQLL